MIKEKGSVENTGPLLFAHAVFSNTSMKKEEFKMLFCEKNLLDFYERFNVTRAQLARLLGVSSLSLKRYEGCYEHECDPYEFMHHKIIWKIERGVYLIEERELIRQNPCSRIENEIYEQQVRILFEKNGVLD